MTDILEPTTAADVLFYRPEDGWLGDPMPCYHDGRFYVYYQCDRRDPAPYPNGAPFGWSLFLTDDLRSGVDFGEVLHKGDPDGAERFLFAGSVIHAEGSFWAFYTGANRAFDDTEAPAETFRIATSPDGIEWTKHRELTMHSPDGFEKNYFRDPVVVFDPDLGAYRLLVAGRHDSGPRVRRGCLLEYRSTDLRTWSFEKVLWSPHTHHLLQMPDLFRIGDWWYLLYSEYDDQRRTRYRMSRSADGPWIAPQDDCFDGRAFYAARTVDVDGRRVIFGWNPTRAHGDDLDPWVWGGNLVAHDVVQRPDGTLGVRPNPELLDGAFEAPDAEPRSLVLSRDDGYAEEIVVAESSTRFRVDFTMEFVDDTFEFGLKLYENSDADQGYVYLFSPGEHRVRFDMMPNYPWFQLQNVGLSRPVAQPAGSVHEVTLIVDDDVCVLYVDDIALSSRMTRRPGQEVKLYVNGGMVDVRDLVYRDRTIRAD
ncbi:family 43 glycosylhydrolase [Microbacterium maritypicum]|uniref:beta-fructofuranosidase n=1 Tax=Microbacterium maritypicum MF109 TaxID=1333857 RepID=T5KE62_MICMQ|nr:family 43 glycosylhydrolase [Microbacterium liquefaciens]EQM74782.1 hypothetical protein L687_04815 [Microbacterium maritypicum MF109]